MPVTRRYGFTTAAACTASALVLAAPAFAQAVPDAGQILRENQQQQRLTPPSTLPVQKEAPALPRPDNEVPFSVTHFRLTGVTQIPETEIQDALKPYLGHAITFTDLRKALAVITEVYQRHGWLARAQLPEQDVSNGEVVIHILEGRLGAIQLRKTGAPRISDERVTNTMLAHQKTGEFLSLSAMDRAINVLNDTPGTAVAATLAPGSTSGTSDIIVAVDEKSLLSASATIDNSGPISTSPWRISGTANLNSPGGFGDEVAINLMSSLGMQYGRAAYSIPLGYDGLRWGVNFSALRYKLRHSFSALDAQGDALTIGTTASYPLVRTSADTITLSATFDYKHFGNSANGIEVSRKSLYTGSLNLGGDTSDQFWGGGLILWNANFAAGNVDLSANPANEAADAMGPRTAGSYARLTANIGRLQKIDDHNMLWLSFYGQEAFKNLDSSEKFWLGGPQGVRAYPVSEANGDSGWLGTAELRHAFSPNWQASLFYDHGSIKANHTNGYNIFALTPNRYGLDSLGAGVTFGLPGRLAFHAYVATALGSNPGANPLNNTDSDGWKSDVRGWVNISVFL
jgi:Hemolysin activation/secretion protein